MAEYSSLFRLADGILLGTFMVSRCREWLIWILLAGVLRMAAGIYSGCHVEISVVYALADLVALPLGAALWLAGRSAEDRYAQSKYWLNKVELYRLRHNLCGRTVGMAAEAGGACPHHDGQAQGRVVRRAFCPGVNPALAQLLISSIREMPQAHD